MNLYEKLIEVRKSVDYLQKEAKGGQYNYTSSSQVLMAIRNELNEHKILLIPEILTASVSEKVEDKTGGKKTITYFTELGMTMTWVNAEKPDEKIKVEWYGQGVDIGGEKGVGKALTYAEKYFILKFFNIPTDKDDPDSFQKKNEKEEKKPELKPGNFKVMEKIFNAVGSREKLINAVNVSKTFSWTTEENAKFEILYNESLGFIKKAGEVEDSFKGEDADG